MCETMIEVEVERKKSAGLAAARILHARTSPQEQWAPNEAINFAGENIKLFKSSE